MPRPSLTATTVPLAARAAGAYAAPAGDPAGPTARGADAWWKAAGFHSRMVPLPFPVAKASVLGLKASALTLAEPCVVSAAPVSAWVLTCHSSVAPSLCAVARVAPPLPNASAPTASPVAMVAPAWFPVVVSQSRMVPSWAPVARNLPSGLNTSACTGGPAGTSAAPATCWLVASHSWTFPSALAAAISLPLGLNATASTGLSSELIGAPISCPVPVFHTRTFPSAPPVTTSLPSGLNATALPSVSPASGRTLIRAWLVRFQEPTASGPATSRTFPPLVNARVTGAEPPQVVALITRCEATFQSRIAPPE